MTETSSFAMLQQLAEQRRDDLTRALGTLLAQLDEAKNRLQLLVDYRNDYQGRLERAVRGGIQGEGLRNYRSFLANLEVGYLMPPVGLNLFLSAYRFDKPLLEVARATLPMTLALFAAVILITYVPAISTWLPRVFGH